MKEILFTRIEIENKEYDNTRLFEAVPATENVE